MTVRIVQQRLDRLLEKETPRIVLISGQWGVGKTYQWKKALERRLAHSPNDSIRYAYVSLFGLQHMAELRKRVAEELISAAEVGGGRSIVDHLSTPVASIPWNKALRLIPAIPYIAKLDTLANDLAFSLVRNAVVVLDDLERTPIPIRDVLGMASFLKEERACRVVLLSNIAQLKEQRAELDVYSEKAIDEAIEFVPTAEEATSVALQNKEDAAHRIFGDYCVLFGLTNIRVIARLLSLVEEIQEALHAYSDTVLTQAISSVVLFGVARFQPSDDFPTPEFLENLDYGDGFRLRTLAEKPDAMTAVQKREHAWLMRMEEMGFGAADALDKEISASLKRGYLDAARLRELAREPHEAAERATTRGIFDDAFDRLWSSFRDDAAEVVAAFTLAIEKSMGVIGVADLNALCHAVTELERPDLVDKAIDAYIDKYKTTPAAFDLAHQRPTMEWHEKVKQRLVKAGEQFALKKSVADALDSINLSDGWNTEDVVVVARMTVDEMIAFFREVEGVEFRRRLNKLKRLAKFGGMPEYDKIKETLAEALKRIGSENGLNAIRARGYLVGEKQV